MTKRLFSLMPLLAIATAVAAQSPQKQPKPATVFFDDFSANTIDRSKWNVTITRNVVNNEQQAYVDSNATIYIAHGAEAAGAQNGALVIKPVFSAGYHIPAGQFDFLSGRLDTRSKMEFTYGSVAARMKLPAGDGLWPAFWALGEGKWPDCGEIDIMENVGEADWISAALHGPGYFGETPLVNKVYLKGPVDATQWHVYSVDWTDSSLLFKVDGQLYYRATRPMIEHYGRWAFDNPKFLILNLALGGAYPVKVNGAKAPYPGLPEKTVADIRAGKVKVLVDWVRITRQ